MGYDIYYWLQAVVNGLMNGGVYALIAVSMTLVFGVLRLVNFAHGALVTVGMYLSLTLFEAPFGINPYLALIPGLALLFGFGWVLYVGLLDRIMKAPLLMQLTFTLGLLVVLEASMEMIWHNDPRRVRIVGMASRIEFGELYVSQSRLIAFVAALVLAGLFWAMLRYTWRGAAISAAAQNPDAAQLVGIPRRSTLAFTFAIATAATGAAGMLLAPFVTMFPYVGHSFLGAAFAAMVIGTEGNILGALVGGILVGLAEALGATWMGDNYKDAFVFGMVLIMLILRPEGLFRAKSGV